MSPIRQPPDGPVPPKDKGGPAIRQSRGEYTDLPPAGPPAAAANGTPFEPPSPRPTPRRGDLRILWWVNAVDGLGSQASGLVFPLLLLELGHSPGTAGAFASAAALAGVVLGPLVAVPADQGQRRRIMTGSAGFAALGTGVLALTCLGRPALWLVIALALLERLCSIVYEAASRGALVHVATVDELPRAAAGMQVGDQVSLILGPALGGALFQLARPLPFLADALSYAAATLGIRAVRTPLDLPAPAPGAPEAGPRPPWRGAWRAWPGAAKAGLATVAGSPVLRLAVVWTSTASGTLTLLFYTALFQLGGGGHSARTGLVLTASGAAGLLGSLVAAPVVRRLGAARVLTSVAWLLPVPCGSLLWADSVWGWGVAFAGLSVLVPLITVVLSSAAVACTPPAVQSRAASVFDSVSALAAAGAPAAAAVLVTTWNTRTPAMLCTVLFVALAVYTQARAHGVLRSGAAAAHGGVLDGRQQ
ncbi:MFS transporter [Streptomyces sp. NPDC127079]|uniref:MFS transporter n=1 Tax=Streptomyces sp. NPDC127079 TaxID=3347132 RepID=UPI003653D870